MGDRRRGQAANAGGERARRMGLEGVERELALTLLCNLEWQDDEDCFFFFFLQQRNNDYCVQTVFGKKTTTDPLFLGVTMLVVAKQPPLKA